VASLPSPAPLPAGSDAQYEDENHTCHQRSYENHSLPACAQVNFALPNLLRRIRLLLLCGLLVCSSRDISKNGTTHMNKTPHLPIKFPSKRSVSRTAAEGWPLRGATNPRTRLPKGAASGLTHSLIIM
jgi:hypothetical protein